MASDPSFCCTPAHDCLRRGATRPARPLDELEGGAAIGALSLGSISGALLEALVSGSSVVSETDEQSGGGAFATAGRATTPDDCDPLSF